MAANPFMENVARNFLAAFSDGFGGAFDFQTRGVPPGGREAKAPPPTSMSVLAALPDVTITGDDLQEENNRCCCVCLEDQEMGGIATKLPCGHIFHRECLEDWLKRTCTCPICRFELKTDNEAYERSRRERVKEGGARMRFRHDELMSFKVSRLKEIIRELDITPPRYCVDKTDLVQAMIDSGKIRVVERMPPKVISSRDLEVSSATTLKALLVEMGVETSDFLEKRDFQRAIRESDRFIVTDADVKDLAGEGDALSSTTSSLTLASSSAAEGVDELQSHGVHNGKTEEKESELSGTKRERDDSSLLEAATSNPATTGTTIDATDTITAEVQPAQEAKGCNLGVKELLGIAEAFGIDTSKCVERSDVVKMLADEGFFEGL